MSTTYYEFCRNNNFDEAIKLIDNNKKKNTALRVFSHNGNYDAVNQLLKLGANPNIRCRRTGLIFIDRTKGPDLSYDRFKSALELAAMKNNSDIVKLFIENGNSDNINNSVILYYFTLYKNMDMIKYLFDKGMTIKAITGEDFDRSSLRVAIKQKMYFLIEYFIGKGLNVNNDEYYYFFHDCYGDKIIMDLLLNNGFDINNFCPGWKLEDDNELQLFIDLIPKGMNFSNEEWKWVLCMACEHGQENIVRTLINYGVDIHNRCDVPYKSAAEYGHMNCLKLLIEKDPDYLPNNKELVTTILSLVSENSVRPTEQNEQVKNENNQNKNNQNENNQNENNQRNNEQVKNENNQNKNNQNENNQNENNQRNNEQVKNENNQNKNNQNENNQNENNQRNNEQVKNENNQRNNEQSADEYEDEFLDTKNYEGYAEIINYIDQIGLLILSDVLLFEASSCGNLDLVKFYVSKCVDFRSENDYALRIALLNKHIPVAEYLISIGCDPTANDNFSLYWSLLRGDNEVVEFLENTSFGSEEKTYLNRNGSIVEFAKKIINKQNI
jgi:ankyrin repeat protein